MALAVLLLLIVGWLLLDSGINNTSLGDTFRKLFPNAGNG